MLLGKIIGTVTPSVTYQGLDGVPLLIVQPLDKTQKIIDSPIIATDSTRMAGINEIVYYEGGREAAMTLETTFVPVDASIIGIVDDVNLLEKV